MEVLSGHFLRTVRKALKLSSKVYSLKDLLDRFQVKKGLTKFYTAAKFSTLHIYLGNRNIYTQLLISHNQP